MLLGSFAPGVRRKVFGLLISGSLWFLDLLCRRDSQAGSKQLDSYASHLAGKGDFG